LEVWRAGDVSDDTEQAICLLDAYLEGVSEGRSPSDTIDVRLVSKHFLHWGATNGRGMGNHTGKVFEHYLFPLEPLTASMDIWEQSGRQAAPNGAVMRTAYIGVIRPWDLDWTSEVAAECAAVTHADPRCKASAVAVSVAIAELVTGAPVNEAIAHAAERASKHDPTVHTWLLHKDLPDLNLDEGLDTYVRGTQPFPPIGYTYKCLGAAFWALRHAQRATPLRRSARERFRKALEMVILAGGDTDTNGAVAGALLGAYLGMDGLPPVLADGLQPRATLDTRLMQLLKVQEGES
jgi:ADP-ribosylglycohydrolase